jgi:hypothetical protein
VGGRCVRRVGHLSRIDQDWKNASGGDVRRVQKIVLAGHRYIYSVPPRHSNRLGYLSACLMNSRTSGPDAVTFSSRKATIISSNGHSFSSFAFTCD